MDTTKARINHTTIELHQGDITQQDVDAIVNAANNSLLGGGGVDGAIHRAAGPDLLKETRTMGGCATGDAKISGGYRLKARHVIHTVGPIYGQGDAPAQLASAYRRSMEVAAENNIQSIAFPAISTGVYGYPLAEAATIALTSVCDFAAEHEQPELVRFVLFTPASLAVFSQALATCIAQRADLTAL